MPVAFTRIIAGLDTSSPFVGPKELERRRGRPYRARLGANECLFGVPPAALRVLESYGAELCFYSDPTHRELREKIAKSWCLTRAHVVVGEGIDGLLELFVRALIEPGDIATTSRGAYPSFDYCVRGHGGRLLYQSYRAPGSNDLDALLAATQVYRAKLLFLANPDNPTGSQVSASDIRQLLEKLPQDCLLLLDEAYVEFAAQHDVLPSSEIRPNLVRLRTFSKAYGLAGARIGYAVADPAVVATLDRIRLHFGVSKLSQEMALAALGDDAFHAEVLAQTAAGREHYKAIGQLIGVKTLPSSTNFVSFDFGDVTRAEAMADWLEVNDIFVRRPVDPPLDGLVRITVGPPAAREAVSQVLSSGMAKLGIPSGSPVAPSDRIPVGARGA